MKLKKITAFAIVAGILASISQVALANTGTTSKTLTSTEASKKMNEVFKNAGTYYKVTEVTKK